MLQALDRTEAYAPSEVVTIPDDGLASDAAWLERAEGGGSKRSPQGDAGEEDGAQLQHALAHLLLSITTTTTSSSSRLRTVCGTAEVEVRAVQRL